MGKVNREKLLICYENYHESNNNFSGGGVKQTKGSTI